jgi:hypothetical protein
MDLHKIVADPALDSALRVCKQSRRTFLMQYSSWKGQR